MTDDEVVVVIEFEPFENSFFLFTKILLLSMLDMNAPKMAAQDVSLFKNIVEDLFPGIPIPIVDYSKVRSIFN